jgi:protein NrfC
MSEGKRLDRRKFLYGLGAGLIVGGGAVAGATMLVPPQTITKTLSTTVTSQTTITSPVTSTFTKTTTTTETVTPTFATSKGYIVVDPKKCVGCLSCMMACSLVHEGKTSLSLSRIQVLNNPFERFPDDIIQEQCKQCVNPPCVAACPTGALHIDPTTGVRVVDKEKCIFCFKCMKACRNVPSMMIPNVEKKYMIKCDLCMDTPYWGEKGGVDGKHACEEACPFKAIKFVKEVPEQLDMSGYYVNLRSKRWEELGLGPAED